MIKNIAITTVLALTSLTSVSYAETLTVATYGGEWGDALRDCILKPFEKASGHKIQPEPGVSAVTLAKIKQQTQSPTIDVAWLDSGVSELADQANVMAPIDTLPGLANVIPQGRYKSRDGSTYAVSTGYYALGLVVNTRDVKTPPTSWMDLWNPEFEGVVAVPSPANAMGVPFLLAINRILGGSLDDVSKGLEKLKTLKTFSFYDTSGNATNAFQSDEVVIAAHYASAAWAMNDKKLPMTYIVPKEGALGGDIRLHLVKNGKHLEASKAFIDFAIQPAQATCMSEHIFVGPATKGVTLTPEAQKRMPWGQNGSIENLIITDWNAMNERRNEINDQWNKAIAR